MRVKSEEFEATYEQTCAVYAKYQMAVHKDRPDDCDKLQVRSFFLSFIN